MRPIGKVGSTVDSDEPFTPTVHMQDLECDNCGHRQKAASLTEYVHRATGRSVLYRRWGWILAF